MFMELLKKKQGPAVYLSLTGRALEAVRIIIPSEVVSSDGLNKIGYKVDSIYSKDESTRAVLKSYKRSSGDKSSDLII